MESVGILAGGIAHDFNNLLAVIVGNTSMMKLNFGENNTKLNNFLDNVEQASSQAADLAQKFITFSEGGWLMQKKRTGQYLKGYRPTLAGNQKHLAVTFPSPRTWTSSTGMSGN